MREVGRPPKAGTQRAFSRRGCSEELKAPREVAQDDSLDGTVHELPDPLSRGRLSCSTPVLTEWKKQRVR